MRKIDIAIVIMVIFVVAMVIGIYIFITGNSKECLANPVEYFEEEADATCTCFNSEGKRFDFGNENPLRIVIEEG